VTTRIRPGHEASLIDVSATGASLETSHRLLPGSSIELHFSRGERTLATRGQVLRCAVSRLYAGSVVYLGAIRFDRHLPWFVDGDGGEYDVPGAETRPGRRTRDDSSHHIV
jgi:PilZ domain